MSICTNSLYGIPPGYGAQGTCIPACAAAGTAATTPVTAAVTPAAAPCAAASFQLPGYACGGAIAPGGCAPAAGACAAAPQAQPPQGGAPQSASTPLGYVHADDAMPQDDFDQLAQHVDPSGKMTNGDQNLAVIQAAHDKGGLPAAWSALQNMRANWNAKMAFAGAALNGTPQKPADPAAAAKALTQAYSHMPDGTEIEFRAAGTKTAAAMPTKPGNQSESGRPATPPIKTSDAGGIPDEDDKDA